MTLAKGSYCQIYVVRASETLERDVAFLCGNYYYEGRALLAVVPALDRVPHIIPVLQKQQHKLQFVCTTSHLSDSESRLAHQVQLIQEAQDCFIEQLSLPQIEAHLNHESNAWIDEKNVYFEMHGLDTIVDENIFACSKTYARGLLIISILLDGVFYFVMSDVDDDQPLLDVRYPDLSKLDKKLHLYSGSTGFIKSIEIYACRSTKILFNDQIESKDESQQQEILSEDSDIVEVALNNLDITNTRYEQTYCILKPERKDNPLREAFFRFNNWCYSGRVELSPEPLMLEDIPYVIPALRIQQNKMKYFCNASNIPLVTPFTLALEKEVNIRTHLENELQRIMLEPLSYAASAAIDGDPLKTFFEIDVESEIDFNIELMVTKSYSSRGVVVISIFFQNKIFLTFVDGSEGDYPLLDSSFPDLTGELLGCIVKEYTNSIENKFGIKSVSVWQVCENTDNDSCFHHEEGDDKRNKNSNESVRSKRLSCNHKGLHHLAPLKRESIVKYRIDEESKISRE